MNRNKLKTYAPQARREFIQAVTDRAAHYGLSAKKIEPMTEQGDVALIDGRPFPKAVGEKRKKLEVRIQKLGFGQTMEAMAYTWFNRLVAIRFMELHGYLEHGYRVLSHPDGRSQPEILEHAQHVDLPGLDKQKVVALKLDGTKEDELYRLLLVGQCNALHKALPFLFEAIDDETELLLPDHLLHSDSLIRKLVEQIPEEDWQEVEIIGWLYQFYISEKKDEVIGKVVRSEDIPAATQLFTPNWIVKYLVQNSLGRQWLATYPNSPIKGQMEYYIEPAEQTPEVQAKLAEITPTSLNPEELTLIDPACGSGHILTEAYDLLQRIYQERGYRAKDIPRLILENNVFGLEIDDRAVQLAAFALMMKARADDRSIFERGVQPHVLAIQESKGLDVREITEALNQPILKEEQPPSGELFEEITDARSPLFSKKSMDVKGAVSQADVAHLISLFEHGKTFGSLIQVPEKLAEKLPAIAERVEAVIAHGGMFEKEAARRLKPLVEQGWILKGRYDAVVMNPPYMGNKFFSDTLKAFIRSNYKPYRADLYSCFTAQGVRLTAQCGRLAMITIPNWLFLSSFEELRRLVYNHSYIESLVHNGRGVWGADFGSCAFILRLQKNSNYRAVYKRLFDRFGLVSSNEELQRRYFSRKHHYSSLRENEHIPGMPIAYWISPALRRCFSEPKIGECFEVKEGLGTRDDDLFLRCFWEVDSSRVRWDNGKEKWVKTDKAGGFRRWAGNMCFVMNWEDDGYAIRNHRNPDGSLKSRPQNIQYFFRPAVAWGKVTAGPTSFRLRDRSCAFNDAAPSVFGDSSDDLLYVLAVLNSSVFRVLLEIQGASVNVTTGVVASLPFIRSEKSGAVISAAKSCISLVEADWNSHETSWGFKTFPLLSDGLKSCTVEESCQQLVKWRLLTGDELGRHERTINEELVPLYGVSGEVEVTPEDSTRSLTESSSNDDAHELISYAVGCMMGRYSLDEPGLIYAHSDNQGFDPSKYRNFPADEDGIIPLTELNWFPDDAASRFEKFIATAWPAETLEENLKFVAESLEPKKGETPRDTIRRYLANDFYKHHLSIYKKRPIYWLFSSGKQRGFQALVYLHRYNEGTLARMRTEYVIPLLGKMTARIAHLTDDSAAATSSQHKKRLETEKAAITKQLAEVQAFDEQLRHFADQRIKLDLDDGVKVNYSKFGDLLAEVKAVCGKSGEED